MNHRRSWFTDLCLLWLIGVSVVALMWPATFFWVRGPWVVGALTHVMLGMGFTLTVPDFRRLLRMPGSLAHDLRQRPVSATADFEECLNRVVAAARAAGKAAGILVRDPSELPQRVQQGFTRLAVESDLALLRDAFRTLIRTTKDIPT